MDNVDMAGYPKRNVGDKLVIDDKKVTVKEVNVPQVLCPCPDMLTVEYADRSTAVVDNGHYAMWDYLGTVVIVSV